MSAPTQDEKRASVENSELARTSSSTKNVDSDENEKNAVPDTTDNLTRNDSISKPGSQTIALKEAEPESERWLTGSKLVIVHSAMMLAILLVALDQSIVATAIPRIVSDFDALSSISWIVSAYFLTQAGLILTYGGILSIAPTKYVFITAITLFELGSLVCAVSKSMNVLIFGRAFSGVGAAGMFGSVIAIIAEICPLEKRPVLFGSFGGVFALSSVMGPLLGGVFTDHVSWRWCFYINLPIGALSVAVISIFLSGDYSALNDPSNYQETKVQRWLRLDWLGTVFCIGMVTVLLLPLQWGGNTKPWKDPSVIALLCVFGVVLVMFLGIEWKMGSRALIPMTLFRNRSQIGCCLAAFWVMLMLLIGIYYLPLFYQAKGHSATKSGIDILPFMLMTVGGAGISGGVITYTGRYYWWLVISPLLATIGAGLLFTLESDSSNAKLIGYQIIYGAGIGGSLQNTFIAIQAEYNDREHLIPKTSSLVTFTQLVGGVIGTAIAGTIFANQLVSEIAHYAPDLPPETAKAVRESVLFIFTLSKDEQTRVIAAYSKAIAYTFVLPIPCGILASLSALLVRNHDIRNMKMGAGGA